MGNPPPHLHGALQTGLFLRAGLWPRTGAQSRGRVLGPRAWACLADPDQHSGRAVQESLGTSWAVGALGY